MSKVIYVKIIVIPILAVAFFVQSFLLSYTSLTFMHTSLPYIGYTSQADITFYGGIGVVQNAILNKGTT